jgi:hypothetical protein
MDGARPSTIDCEVQGTLEEAKTLFSSQTTLKYSRNARMDIFLIILGLAFLIASMALILNPPEAWVKRAFRKDAGKPPSPVSREVSSSSEDRLQTPGQGPRQE